MRFSDLTPSAVISVARLPGICGLTLSSRRADTALLQILSFMMFHSGEIQLTRSCKRNWRTLPLNCALWLHIQLQIMYSDPLCPLVPCLLDQASDRIALSICTSSFVLVQ